MYEGERTREARLKEGVTMYSVSSVRWWRRRRLYVGCWRRRL